MFLSQLAMNMLADNISVDALWSRVLEALRTQVSRATYEGWIRSIVAEELTDDCLTLRTDNFGKKFISRYYAQFIKNAATEIIGYPLEVKIIASAPKPAESIDLASKPAPTAPSLASPLLPHANLNAKYTFNRFVVGATNRMAHAAALAVAESPGREFNPLFLCGGVGLGKTHLMQAIAHYRLEIQPSAKIAYVSTEQFTNDLITAIRKDGTQSFRNQYREVDMLLIDDIQFIEGKEYTQEEFFHTFNALYESGKQIILASDRPPAQIPRLQERLSSRFSMGLIADIQVPDLETRMAILQKKAEYEGIRLPSQVVQYIAASYNSNIRELEGALIRAVTYISVLGVPMTVENVAPVLNPPKEPIEVSADLVLRVVCELMKISVEDLLSQSRRKDISHGRKVAMYLMRQHTNLSLPKIGEALGGKDHTTVIYSCDRVLEQQTRDPEFALLLRQLSDRIYLEAQGQLALSVG